MSSHSKAAMGSSRSEESKKRIQCGICKPPYAARRDYMKATHFPTKHPGQAYLEKGERTLSFNVSVVPNLLMFSLSQLVVIAFLMKSLMM